MAFVCAHQRLRRSLVKSGRRSGLSQDYCLDLNLGGFDDESVESSGTQVFIIVNFFT